jgi:cell shape-determining protein MreD
MSSLSTVSVLLAAFLVVFLETSFRSPRVVLGVQLDFLPALMTYTALSGSLTTVTLLALCGGLWFDSFSANPLGITILPLFLAGAVIHYHRSLLLRDQLIARCLLGMAASAVVPALVLGLLLATGHNPLMGLLTLWQWLILALSGALITPVLFKLFDWLNQAVRYPVHTEPAFRPDRDIKRGR